MHSMNTHWTDLGQLNPRRLANETKRVYVVGTHCTLSSLPYQEKG